jgi:2-polyprenyl-6-methoxyphenol hydroxylase-like FAD-dependent oxidoreductase
VRSLVIEKYPERLAAPKAHALSPRSLEICRQFGLDTKTIRALGTERKNAYWVNFVTNLSGERIGVLPYERMDFEVLLDTPEVKRQETAFYYDTYIHQMIHNIPQPTFEEFLASGLAIESETELKKGVSFVSCTQVRKIRSVELRELPLTILRLMMK